MVGDIDAARAKGEKILAELVCSPLPFWKLFILIVFTGQQGRVSFWRTWVIKRAEHSFSGTREQLLVYKYGRKEIPLSMHFLAPCPKGKSLVFVNEIIMLMLYCRAVPSSRIVSDLGVS